MSDEKRTKTTEKYGIEELMDIVVFTVDMMNAIELSRADGTIDWKDALHLIRPLTNIPAAIKDADKVKVELTDYSEAEEAQIIAFVKEKLETNDEYAKKIASKAVKLAVGIAEMVAIVAEGRQSEEYA